MLSMLGLELRLILFDGLILHTLIFKRIAHIRYLFQRLMLCQQQISSLLGNSTSGKCMSMCFNIQIQISSAGLIEIRCRPDLASGPYFGDPCSRRIAPYKCTFIRQVFLLCSLNSGLGDVCLRLSAFNLMFIFCP